MLGYPVVDPIAGIFISVFIFWIVVGASKDIFKRLLDIVDPELIDKVEKITSSMKEVKSVHDVKARWIGHSLRVNVSIAVNENLSVREGHNVAVTVHRKLIHEIPHLENVTIHIDPESEIGEIKHSTS